MADYMRKIIYLRKEEKGISMPRAGFARWEKRRGKFLLYLVAEEERLANGQPIFLVFEENGNPQAVKIGETQKGFPQEISGYVGELPKGIKPELVCGIILGEEDCYLVGECPEYQRNISYKNTMFQVIYEPEIKEDFPQKEESVAEAAVLEEKKEEKKSEEEHEQKRMKFRDPFLEKLSEMYPFEDDEMEWCLQMQPADFSSFPMEYWHYGSNSFLLQGFYNYRHLLYSHSNGKNYVGVPGQFHRREQYLAQRFGFPRFKGTQNKPITVGDFGYWLREL